MRFWRLQCLIVLCLWGASLSEAGAAEESADVSDEADAVGQMTVSDLAALFQLLTKELPGPMVDHVRQQVATAAADYEEARIFEGADPDAGVWWSGEANYRPLSGAFDVSGTVRLDKSLAEETGLAVSGEADFSFAGFWNPWYHGLTSVGFPSVTQFNFEGELRVTGRVEETLDVLFRFDGTVRPAVLEFVVNGHDWVREIRAASDPVEE